MLEHYLVCPLTTLATCFGCHAADTASLATWVLFGKLIGVATLVDFGEKRCRKNLPSCAPDRMAPRQYQYVGPSDIRDSALASSPAGTPIRSIVDLTAWIESRSPDTEPDGSLIATFTVDTDHTLLLAPRRSEHVACASGGPVLSAGEITFSADGDVSEITNQSTGFCPEPESWSTVAAALDAIPVERPDDFSTRIVFRLCPACNERNIVKDGWFVCDLCGADLPENWNFPLLQRST